MPPYGGIFCSCKHPLPELAFLITAQMQYLSLPAKWGNIDTETLMMKIANILAVIDRYASLLLIGLFVLMTPQASAEIRTEQLNTIPMERSGQWGYAMDGLGAFWFSYYDPNRFLHLRDPMGKESILVEPQLKSVPSGLVMAGLPEGVNVIWRQKFPNKKLFLHNTNHSEKDPVEFGEGTEPLTRIKAIHINDTLHLLWYGEAGDPLLNQQYFVFYSNLNDEKGEISNPERLSPGIYPVWASDPAGNIMAFSWITDARGGRIVAMTRPSDAADFGPPVTLADVPSLSQIFQAFRSGQRWFVVWETRYEKNRLEGAYSDDLGKTWQRFAFAELDDFVVGSIDIATDDEGRINLALSGSDTSVASPKQDLRLIRSTDRGENWTITRPRPDNISKRFRALNPSVKMGPVPGQVMLVWEDWRNLRGQLYVSFSQDHGQTWLYNNLPLPQPMGINRGLTDDISAIYFQDQAYHVIAQQPTDDSFSGVNLIDVKFSPSDLAEITPATPQSAQDTTTVINAITGVDDPPATAVVVEGDQAIVDPLKIALINRVNGFWQSMMNKDYEGAYRYQDPFYRAKIRQDTYAQQLGRIQYHEAKIEAVQIDGPIATVYTRIRADVPPFRASTGEMITRPESEVKITETWVLIDGDWYREYYSEYLDKKYTRH